MRYTKETVERALSLVPNLGVRGTAKVLGILPSTVSRWAKRAGVRSLYLWSVSPVPKTFPHQYPAEIKERAMAMVAVHGVRGTAELLKQELGDRAPRATTISRWRTEARQRGENVVRPYGVVGNKYVVWPPRRFSEEVKRDAVRLADKAGTKKAAAVFGVTQQTIRKWRKEFGR